MRSLALLLPTLAILFPSPSPAYSLSDHRQITLDASQLVLDCYPGTLNHQEIESLIDANLWEDQNVLRKWTEYSHFYHPEHDFRSLRATSRDRMLNLESQLKRRPPASRSLDLLGKALHHLQDMTVPPHVVPVNHIWTDGFEALPTGPSPLSRTRAGADCTELLNTSSLTPLSELHQSLAEQTWRLVRDGSIPALRVSHGTERRTRLPLQAFWSTNGASEWGSYGIFGNAFGSERLSAPMGTYRIRRSDYVAVKAARMQSAARASALAIARVLLLGR